MKGRRRSVGSAANYVALAGEFYVLAELALRRFDGTLTLGHTKEIDILVLNRRTGRTFKLEVKTTGKGVEQRTIFGRNYSWLMNEKHERVRARDLIYCFVLLDHERPAPRVFLVPSRDVAAYVRWEHRHWKRHSTSSRTGKPTSMRVFRIPAEDPLKKWLPPRWGDGRWKRYEGNWSILGPSPGTKAARRR